MLTLFTKDTECDRCREAEAVYLAAAPMLNASKYPTVIRKVNAELEADLALRMGVSTVPAAVLLRADDSSAPERLAKVGRSVDELVKLIETLLSKRSFTRPIELASPEQRGPHLPRQR